MQRHFRYIFRQLLGPLILVVISLSGVVWLTQSLRFIDLIVNKGLSISLFLTLTVLLIPSLLSIILPIALFAAVIYTYHRLITDSEIVVLRATGMSNLRLSGPAVALGAVVAIAVLIVNLYFMPVGFRLFKDMQFEIRHSVASVLLQEGVFNSPIDGLTIYVGERDSGGELADILVHDSRDPVQPSTLMAERGMLVRTPDGPRFVLLNGSRQTLDAEDGQLSMLYFESYAFDFGADSEYAPGRLREPKERFLHELFWPEPGVEDRHRREFLAEGHRRLVSPLFAIVMALIATASLLTGEFNRRGQTGRILTGIAVAVVFQAASFGSYSALVAMPWLAPAYYMATIGFGLLAAYALATTRSWRFRTKPERVTAV
jgi:lipopolysaccharide export system permease protein